ncbi:MAG: hypothetical protein IVW53_08980 [Chloroflexi bacterium]|nr:hypothetical protein [Chloroflexota bacterium]
MAETRPAPEQPLPVGDDGLSQVMSLRPPAELELAAMPVGRDAEPASAAIVGMTDRHPVATALIAITGGWIVWRVLVFLGAPETTARADVASRSRSDEATTNVALQPFRPSYTPPR